MDGDFFINLHQNMSKLRMVGAEDISQRTKASAAPHDNMGKSEHVQVTESQIINNGDAPPASSKMDEIDESKWSEYNRFVASKIPADSPKRSSKTSSKAKPSIPSGSDSMDPIAYRAYEAMKEEVKEIKGRKKDLKTFCATCGRHKDTGARLQTCGRCKSINYCSAKCQKDDWMAGHKVDCASFKQPPLAKTFDTADRHDVPWPVDPVLAQGNSSGIGVWVTPSPKMIASPMETAYHPADGADDLPYMILPPSFRRWAGIRMDNVPNMKYAGPTLLCLRFMIQNRRKDGKAIFYNPSRTLSTLCRMPKEVLLPKRHQGFVLHAKGSDGSPTMSFCPWVDYNNQIRVAIKEINGVEMPQGKFGPDFEYQKPSPPTGAPWGRVVDWDTGSVVLGPGDYSVFRIQYRVGDGTTWSKYPDVVTRYIVSFIFVDLLDVKSGVGGKSSLYFTQLYENSADVYLDDEWLSKARQLALNRSENSDSIHILVKPDFEYVRQYYEPYFDEDADAWVEKRFGKRAAAMNEMWLKAGPEMMRATLDALSPRAQEEMIRLTKAMDPNSPIEQAVREAKQL